jgi:hypothetical protein
VHCTKVFRMVSSNLSLATKSCACVSAAFLSGIISWSVDSTCAVFKLCYDDLSNVATKWITHLLRIRLSPSFESRPRDRLPWPRLVILSQSFIADVKVVPKIGPWPLPSMFLQIHSSLLFHLTSYGQFYRWGIDETRVQHIRAICCIFQRHDFTDIN